MDNYRIVQQLGQGNFGIVSLCESLEDGQLYVVKQVNLRGMSEEQRAGAQREVHSETFGPETDCCNDTHGAGCCRCLSFCVQAELLSQLRHPCIVGYHDSILVDDTLWIVMEYCDGGDLAQRITEAADQGMYFTEAQVLDWYLKCILTCCLLMAQQVRADRFGFETYS